MHCSWQQRLLLAQVDITFIKVSEFQFHLTQFNLAVSFFGYCHAFHDYIIIPAVFWLNELWYAFDINRGSTTCSKGKTHRSRIQKTRSIYFTTVLLIKEHLCLISTVVSNKKYCSKWLFFFLVLTSAACNKVLAGAHKSKPAILFQKCWQ